MRRVSACLTAVLVLFAFVSCQSTPDQAFVIKKDTERMVEQAGNAGNGTKLENLDIPKGRYVFESVGADGRLRIKVDAAVKVPDSPNIPILHVSMTGFSQETVTGVFNYLFPNEKPYDRTSVQTKAEIEGILLSLQKKLADGSYRDNDYTEEEYKALIAQWEAQYAAAPETAPERTMSDGTMQFNEIKDTYMLDVATDIASFSAMNPVDAAGRGGIYAIRYRRDTAPDYNTLGIVRTDGTDIPDEAQSTLTIPFANAKALCDGFFAAAGMAEEFCMGASFVVDDRGTGLTGKFVGGKYVEDAKTPAEHYAYQFYYTRKAGAVCVAVNTKEGSSNTDGFAIPWGYEYACLTVDCGGIAQILWESPIEIDEPTQESSVLKPFDQAMQVFETMIKTVYEAGIETYYGEQTQIEINVDSIELCLLRIREQNGEDTAGLLVPAWVFYGHNIMRDDTGIVTYDFGSGGGTHWPEAPVVLLAVNAVDGSIIDLAKGY
ncbi:MAG TPA: DUF6034 family protein [Clostridia bacterium]|nr:DUF6034 family protein [Clostridia bacterium]